MIDQDKEKLVQEILGYLDAHVVKEIDFMPVSQPPYVVLESSTLGIAMTQLKSVYAYVYRQLLCCIEGLQRKEAPSSGFEGLWTDLHKYSLVALTIKGDLLIAYTARKKLLAHHPHRLDKEFLLLQAVFSKHPKSPSGWEHRRWCYRQLRGDKSQSFSLSIAEIETERDLCQQMADKYPKNYYAWMHRLWLLPYMTAHQMDDELFALYAWLRTHISDHSAAHHLVGVVTRIANSAPLLAHCWRPVGRPPSLEEENNPLWTFLWQQWQASGQLLEDRPGHDSLWSLRKGLFLLLQSRLSPSSVPSAQSQHSLLQLNLKGLIDTTQAEALVEDQEKASPEESPVLCQLDLLEREVHFVQRQVVAARASHSSLWDPHQQQLTALRSLLFMLHQHLAKEEGADRIPWLAEYKAIVQVVESLSGGRTSVAYLEAISCMP